MCTNGLALARRAPHLNYRPGLVGFPSEGLTLEDLDEVGTSHQLSVVRATLRLVDEELGVRDYVAHVVPRFVAAVPCNSMLLVELRLTCTFEALVNASSFAPDGDEQVLVFAENANEALALYASEMTFGERYLLEALAAR
ncbi:MAG: hypothetical protein OK454_09025 [Thaumarchaeota archaeon]|nr:hypothetical protein [Nitrososphaerota archaeon]